MDDYSDFLGTLHEGLRPAAARFLHWLGQTEDRSLLVLRSQLLVEEQLREALAILILAPQYLSLDRLSFYRLLRLFQAISGAEDANASIRFLYGLNKLRNDIAHNLEVEQLESRMAELTSIIAPRVDTRIAPEHKVPYLFSLSVSFVAGWIASFHLSSNGEESEVKQSAP